MKFNRFLPFPLLGAFFLLIAISACRHTNPTEPNNTDTMKTGDSCCHGMIGLHVHDSATGAQLHGATVTLTGPNGDTRTETSNGDGYVQFTNLCPGRYVLHTSDSGYQTRETVIEPTCNDTLHQDVSLARVPANTDCCGGRITLIVRDSATRTALDGGSATLYHNGAVVSSKSMTATGTVWDGLCPGQYAIAITKDGYQSVHYDIDSLGCNTQRSTDHNLTAVQTNIPCDSASITVRVDSASTDHFLSGVHVTIRMDGHDAIIDSGVTTDGGYFSAYHLQGNATYIITFSKDGYHEIQESMVIGDCRNYTETYGLSPQ